MSILLSIYICSSVKHCLTLVIEFYWGSFEARKQLNNRHKSDLIQYQTGNGLRHAGGPVHLPIQPLHLCHQFLPGFLIQPPATNLTMSK